MTESNGGAGTAPRADGLRKSEVEGLEARLARRAEGLGFLQLILRTFSTLDLATRNSICDTLTSMVATHLGARHGMTVAFEPGAGQPTVAARYGLPDDADWRGTGPASFWSWLAGEKFTGEVWGELVRERWPVAPPAVSDGFLCAPILNLDRTVGLLWVSRKGSGQPFHPEDGEFLAVAASIGALALSNAEARAAQEELIHDVERRAAESKRESEEKAKALHELDEQLEIVERQRSAIRELSTPILQLWDNVLALPVIGVVDSKRAADIMERLLSEITARQVRFVILDITGVEVVDTRTADHFAKMVQAARLLGSSCIITGIRPAVAQTLVEIGVDLSAIATLRNLREGLRECLRRMEEDQGGRAAAR